MTYVSTAKASPDRIREAVDWLLDHWHVAPQPITKTLRLQFGLNFVDAAKVIAAAERLHRESGRG